MPEDSSTKRLTAQIEFTEEMYRGVIYLDTDGNVLSINKSLAEKLGFTHKKEDLKNIFQICPQLNYNKWKKFWSEMLEKGKAALKTQCVNSEGKIVPISFNCNALDVNGIIYCQGVFEDEFLNIHANYYLAKSCLDNMNNAILWINKQGQLLYYNKAFLSLIGFERSEVKGIDFIDLVHGYDIEDLEEDWNFIEEKKKVVKESKLNRKDGNNIWVEIDMILIYFKQDKVANIVLTDISEKKLQQNKLKTRLEEIRELKDQLEEEKIFLKEEIHTSQHFENIVSRSPNYKKVIAHAAQVAETDATVLIQGETGTGKELLAKAIYRLSKRSEKPLITVNCSVLPENLIESELFGHEKGAFTGAYKTKTGRFEKADGGTIFLDEIGDLPLELQVKLLRVLQEGTFERVGGMETKSVNVRVIAATNRDLEKLVGRGKFREDLFYRLNVFPIYNIPLRERKDDIPLLIKHFLNKYNNKMGKNVEEIPQSIMKKLHEYDYPGNVRELENIIERAIILSPGKTLIANFQFKQNRNITEDEEKSFYSMEEMQRRYILKALNKTKGKVTGKGGAAELLKMKGKTLYSRMRKLGIERSDYV